MSTTSPSFSQTYIGENEKGLQSLIADLRAHLDEAQASYSAPPVLFVELLAEAEADLATLKAQAARASGTHGEDVR